MNLQEARAQFPQYADIPDREFATALHSRFYKDMPVSEFFQKIGMDDRGKPRAVKVSAAEQIANDHITQAAQAGPAAEYLKIATPEFMSQDLEKAAYNTGGKVTDLTGSPAAGYAANVGVQAIPALYGSGIGEAIGSRLGPRLMQSALKPGARDIANGRAARAVNTLLNEGHNVTTGGVSNMLKKSRGLTNQVDTLVNQSTQTVPLGTVNARMMRELNAASDLPFGRAPASNAIYNVWDEFLTHPRVSGTSDMPVALAQSLKRRGDRLLGDAAYLRASPDPTEIAARKALVSALREGVETAVPQVGPLNARASDLLNATRVASHRAGMEANKDIAGLSPWGFGVNPAVGTAMMADRNALFKSILARTLYNGGRPAGAAGGAALGASTATED